MPAALTPERGVATPESRSNNIQNVQFLLRNYRVKKRDQGLNHIHESLKDFIPRSLPTGWDLFLQNVLFWQKCVMNHGRMSVMISIICVCCTSNCPRGKFLRSMKVGCLGSKSALFTSLLQKQHKNITSECCLLVTFYHHLHISHVLLCTMNHWRDCDLLKTPEQWTKWIGRPGVWTLKMHEVSTHFIVRLMQSPLRQLESSTPS